MYYTFTKETANYVVKMELNLKAREVSCKVYSRADGLEVFNQTTKVTAHRYVEPMFIKHKLSSILQKDVEDNRSFVSSSYVSNETGNKVAIECQLRSKATSKILLRHEYKLGINDLLDDIDAPIDAKWFQEVCA
ncbi:MAG: hypothetical protein IJ019_02810 [Alphaproteobacteria bacterium]|nr:hypothetical protein [Alphaproteobacteria bacterium]